jgi:hypothetical protein
MPPLPETADRKAMLSCALGEVREMMNERLNLNPLLLALEIGFGPLILSERMKFANKKLTSCHKHAVGLGKNDGQISNVFQYQVTDNQVHGFILTRPCFREIRNDECYTV